MLSSESLEGTENQSKRAAVVVFGEVLFDCFPDGERVLGGAPFNVAWGLRGFGHSPVFISAVGDDADGQSIRAKMDAWAMSTAGLQTDNAHASGSVQVTIQSDEPSYEICEDRAWDFIEDQGWEATEMIYHGLLGLRSERSRKTFEALVERSNAKRFFDINLRPPYDSEPLIKKWIRGVDWLKLNIDELESLLSDSVDFGDSTATEAAVHSLRVEYGIQNVLLTGGRQGARIFSECQQASCMPAPKPDVLVDTVGAGDSFSAYTLHGILSGMPIAQIVREASQFAAKVCGMQGATTLNQKFYQ